MRVDVVFGGTSLLPGDVAGRVVAVIDVLRASTSIACAMANGARAVVPLESSDDVIMRAKAFARDDVLMAGERKMLPDSGLRSRELSARVHAEGRRSKDGADDDDKRHAGHREHAGRA